MGGPSGGEKDMASPILLNADPENYSLQFQSQEIRLRFDEYLVLDESKILISPPLEEDLNVSMRGKEIRISFQETLLPNTTYTISLEEAIKDLNEGNPFRGAHYIFSTGAYLDSAFFMGKLVDPQNPKGPENFVIGLYPAEDSRDSLTASMPQYYTRTDKEGRFRMDYLAKGEYVLFAFEDLNGDLRPDVATDRLAILHRTLEIPSDTLISHFTIYAEQIAPMFRGARQVLNNELQFLFGGRSFPWKIENLSLADSSTTYLWNREDTIRYFYKTDLDSMHFIVHGPDSIDSSLVYLRKKPRKKVLSVRSSIKDGTILPDQILTLHFPAPIVQIRADSIKLVSGDRIIEYTLMDSIAQQGYLMVNFTHKYGDGFRLEITDSCFRDITGRWNDSLTLDLKVPLERELGRVRVKNLEGSGVHPELWNMELSTIYPLLPDGEGGFISSGLVPGIYVLRLIGDRNLNGSWDPGDMNAEVEAEKVYFYPEIIQVRENWDLEYEISKEFVEELTN
jgi:hypothetical protein